MPLRGHADASVVRFLLYLPSPLGALIYSVRLSFYRAR